MFHSDHPPPHVHAEFAEFDAVVGIDPVAVVSGQLPRRAERLVLEWVALHQSGLQANRRRARRFQPLRRIDPLP